MTDTELILSTYQMRQAQIRFFGAMLDKDKRAALRESKRLEQLVDRGLRERVPELEELEQFGVMSEEEKERRVEEANRQANLAKQKAK